MRKGGSTSLHTQLDAQLPNHGVQDGEECLPSVEAQVGAEQGSKPCRLVDAVLADFV